MSISTEPVQWSSLTAPERIRLLLLSKRVTSRRLAECMNWERVQAGESGITENAVSNYLLGVRTAPEWFYKHAAALLNIDESELLDAPAIRPSVSASL